MTKHEIFDFLSLEHTSHSEDSKIVRIIHKNGQVLTAHFIKDSQDQALMNQNKWIVTFLENPIGVSTIYGDDIESLKVGAKPFN